MASEAQLLHELEHLTLLPYDAPKFQFEDTTPEKENMHTSKCNATITPISLCPPTPPPEIQLEYEVSTSPKLQHFSKKFNVWTTLNDTEVGQVRARYIDRARLKRLKPKSMSKSLQELNDGDSDALAFTQQLFNDNGTLQANHMMYPWGKELNKGTVLILSYLMVEKEFRRQGIARILFNAVIKKAKNAKGGLQFMFVRPGAIPSDLDDAILDSMSSEEQVDVARRVYDNAVRFYRSFGFRRVGYSKWFCLAMDPMHLSHQITPIDDRNPPK
ncbi:hypothetical protein BKA65DRAFT_481749 [Rhexocercosporidium sp. MPI-PUGE-AT-0058]|nr:hypothetical protein BKA65DRAFT_481749 [Rhexocercosporidium sp. MPI-PUGE-AT-0058]